MFNNIDYNRFNLNNNRASFNSIKKKKSQKYMSVKTNIVDINEKDFDEFNKIEFEENEKEIHEMYDEKPTEFNNNNNMNMINPVEEVNINDNIMKSLKTDILKKQTMLKFMSKSQKLNKYERKI